MIPADGRLIQSSNLKLREDMLTGESDDVVKNANSIVDMDIIYTKTEKFKSVTKDIIRVTYDNQDINKIKELFLKNDFEVDKLEVSFGDELRIKNENEIDSIFGKILRFDKYKIKVNITGYKNEVKIDFKE